MFYSRKRYKEITKKDVKNEISRIVVDLGNLILSTLFKKVSCL